MLRPGGRFVVVEPWTTPFLRVVHRLARQKGMRRAWGKLDALACMIDREQETYFNWLSRPIEILNVLGQSFQPVMQRVAWGKLSWLGVKHQRGAASDHAAER